MNKIDVSELAVVIALLDSVVVKLRLAAIIEKITIVNRTIV